MNKDMPLALSSWAFPSCTLEETARIAQALGIGALDVGLFGGPGLDRKSLLETPKDLAISVKQLGVRLSNFNYLFGETMYERVLCDPDSLEANLSDFTKVVEFCAEADVPSVMVLPSPLQPGQSRIEALEQTARALTPMLTLTQGAGLTLAIEPHIDSYLDSPSQVLALLERVPNLRLTFDPSHFICLGYQQQELEGLLPFAAHVHLRQAKPGFLQTKLHLGTINFPTLLSSLNAVGYKGYLALEHQHNAYMDMLHDDVLTETVRMRDLVRSYLT